MNSYFSNLSFQVSCGDSTNLLPAVYHDTGWRKIPYYILVNKTDTETLYMNKKEEYTLNGTLSHLIPKNEVHRMVLKSFSGPDPRSVWCHFDLFLYQSLDFLSFFEIPHYFSPELSESLRKICLRLITEKKASELQESIRVETLGFEMISEILTECREREESPERIKNLQKILPALTYIRNHPGADFSLEQAAESVSLSVSRFSAVFCRMMKISPYAYRNKLRMAYSYDLLRSGNESLKEIASLSGFYDEAHFCKAFRAQYGMTPGNLRGRGIPSVF